MSDSAAAMIAGAILVLAAAYYFGPYDRARRSEIAGALARLRRPILRGALAASILTALSISSVAIYRQVERRTAEAAPPASSTRTAQPDVSVAQLIRELEADKDRRPQWSHASKRNPIDDSLIGDAKVESGSGAKLEIKCRDGQMCVSAYMFSRTPTRIRWAERTAVEVSVEKGCISKPDMAEALAGMTDGKDIVVEFKPTRRIAVEGTAEVFSTVGMRGALESIHQACGFDLDHAAPAADSGTKSS